MPSQSPREREEYLLAILLRNRTSPEGEALVELLGLKLEGVKHLLVGSPLPQVPLLQGQAQFLETFLKKLNQKPSE